LIPTDSTVAVFSENETGELGEGATGLEVDLKLSMLGIMNYHRTYIINVMYLIDVAKGWNVTPGKPGS
jgi:hypothetical protein